MSLRTLTRSQLGTQRGYFDPEGRPSYLAIANLLRAPLSRWRLSPRRDVLEHARSGLRAGGIQDVSDVPRVLQRLVDLGECDEVYVGREAYLAPSTPRWIFVGDRVGAYLGVPDLPEGLSSLDGDHHDLVRRFRIDTDDDLAALELVGVEEVSLAEWLVPPAYLRHASRRIGRPARSDQVSLAGFWQLLEKNLTEEGLPLGADADMRVLSGHPGEFFGHHYSFQPEGRWTTDPGNGIWCAYRGGYGDAHWHPCIISVVDDVRRVLDLYNEDEWRWAVLARGRHIGGEEVVQIDGLSVQLTFPAPRQLRAGMDILGRPSGAWAWEVNPDAPDFWGLLT